MRPPLETAQVGENDASNYLHAEPIASSVTTHASACLHGCRGRTTWEEVRHEDHQQEDVHQEAAALDPHPARRPGRPSRRCLLLDVERNRPPRRLRSRRVRRCRTTPRKPDLTGHWRVVPGPADQATTAGYRVVEKVAGGLASDTATGRTGHVTGSVTVVGKKVTAAEFTVNMTTLKSDKSLRDSVLKTVAIQTSKYPTASFTLTDPIALAGTAPGAIERVTAHGMLKLHGVSRSVSVPLQYQQTGTGFRVLADMPIVMADYAHQGAQHRRRGLRPEPRHVRGARQSRQMNIAANSVVTHENSMRADRRPCAHQPRAMRQTALFRSCGGITLSTCRRTALG